MPTLIYLSVQSPNKVNSNNIRGMLYRRFLASASFGFPTHNHVATLHAATAPFYYRTLLYFHIHKYMNLKYLNFTKGYEKGLMSTFVLILKYGLIFGSFCPYDGVFCKSKNANAHKLN